MFLNKLLVNLSFAYFHQFLNAIVSAKSIFDLLFFCHDGFLTNEVSFLEILNNISRVFISPLESSGCHISTIKMMRVFWLSLLV